MNKQYGANMYKKTLMIDLDGVLNNYTKYEENFIPDIKEGAKEFLEKLHKSGKYELVLFTTRNKELSQNWLKKWDIDCYFKEVTNIKKPAYIYIDDRALKFENAFEKTFEDIEKFTVYWKE